jgi:peptidoglycan/xylan/chitin deacetylase (PgdA/CDA1 family)
MSLIALLYHRAQACDYGNAPAMLDAHFSYIAANCRCVLPGDPLEQDAVNVCLTFDDAYFDFYAVVFPLLQRHGLSAVLAVPPAVIHERAEFPSGVRLGCEANVNYNHPNQGGFCTWPELREMAHSGRIAIAAHGLTHCRLDRPDADLQSEIVASQILLSRRLGRPVDSFMFPYGRFSPAALACAQQHYRHSFRIGGADNPGWDSQLLYRVNADRLPAPDAPFAKTKRARYRARYLWNKLRRR